MADVELLEQWISGVLITLLCVFGLIGNTFTLIILNVNSDMRRKPINSYLTVLALYDNGVLFNALLMLSVPSIYKWSLQTQAEPGGLVTLPPGPVGPVPSPSSLSFVNSSQRPFPLPVSGLNGSNQLPGTLASDWIDGQLTTMTASTALSTLLSDPESHLSAVNGSEVSRDPLLDTQTAPEAPAVRHNNPLHLYIRIVYPLALTSQTGSIWTTCLITVERYLAVCHPLRAMALSTRSRALYALLLMTLGAILFNVSRFAEVSIVHHPSGVTIVQPSALRRNVVYKYLYYICLHLALLYVIPLTLLSVLNVKIYLTVRQATRARNSLTRSQQSELNVASMLVLLVAIFISCNVPAFMVNCLEIIQSKYYEIAVCFSNLLVCFNSSVNFLIYCIYGSKFRQKLRHLVCGGSGQGSASVQRTNRNQQCASFAAETYV